MIGRMRGALIGAGLALAATPALACGPDGGCLSWPSKVEAYGFESALTGVNYAAYEDAYWQSASYASSGYESYGREVSVSEYSNYRGGFDSVGDAAAWADGSLREGYAHTSRGHGGGAYDERAYEGHGGHGLAGGPPAPEGRGYERRGYETRPYDGGAYAGGRYSDRQESHGYAQGAHTADGYSYGYGPAIYPPPGPGGPPCPQAGGERVLKCVYSPWHREISLRGEFLDGGVGVIPSGGGGGGGGGLIVVGGGMASAGARGSAYASASASASATAHASVSGGFKGGHKGGGGCSSCGGKGGKGGKH